MTESQLDPNLELFILNLLKHLRDDLAIIRTYSNLANYINNIKNNDVFIVHISKAQVRENILKFRSEAIEKTQ